MVPFSNFPYRSWMVVPLGSSINSIVFIASSMACKLNLNWSGVCTNPPLMALIFINVSMICVLAKGFLVLLILSRQASTRMKVPDRPIPAEQWTMLGASGLEGCMEVTVFKNLRKVAVDPGTPKSGHVK